jgi:hypothetical protein
MPAAHTSPVPVHWVPQQGWPRAPHLAHVLVAAAHAFPVLHVAPTQHA